MIEAFSQGYTHGLTPGHSFRSARTRARFSFPNLAQRTAQPEDIVCANISSLVQQPGSVRFATKGCRGAIEPAVSCNLVTAVSTRFPTAALFAAKAVRLAVALGTRIGSRLRIRLACVGFHLRVRLPRIGFHLRVRLPCIRSNVRIGLPRIVFRGRVRLPRVGFHPRIRLPRVGFRV